MATLNIINNISMTSQGSTTVVKQGTSTSDSGTAFQVSVDGNVHQVKSTLATASVVTLWDEDDDTPANFDYFIYWADQDTYLQFISAGAGSPTNGSFIIKVEANEPFVMPGFDEMLAQASTTAITGGTEPSGLTNPTWGDIDSIVMGNYSGSTVNYNVAVID